MTTEWSWVLFRVDGFGLTLSAPITGFHGRWAPSSLPLEYVLSLFLGSRMDYYHGKFVRFCIEHPDSLFLENASHLAPTCTGPVGGVPSGRICSM